MRTFGGHARRRKRSWSGVVICPYCDAPLDDSRPWQPALDGGGAHLDCLEAALPDEEEDPSR